MDDINRSNKAIQVSCVLNGFHIANIIWACWTVEFLSVFRSARPLKNLPTKIILVLCCGLIEVSGCAAVDSTGKAQLDVWARLERGEPVSLIVTLDDTEIRKQALELNITKGIMFDDPDTLRFKAARYAALKSAVLLTLPSEQVQIVKEYDALPMMFLKFRSSTTLKALLSNPSVLRADEDKNNSLINGTQK